jgi:hypothetical protein
LVSQGKESIFRRKDDKYFIYLPKKVVEDTTFPFKLEPSVKVKVSFTPNKKKNEILIEEI